jgi:hypothetical protein
MKEQGEDGLRITLRQDKRLGTVLGPFILVVKLAGVPDHLKLSVPSHNIATYYCSRGGLSTYLVVNLRDLDRVRSRTGSINHGKRGGTISGVGDVVHVVGCVKILAVPAAVRHHHSQTLASTSIRWGRDNHVHGEDDARPDTARARPRRKALGIKPLVEAGRISVAAKVGGGITAIATLDPAAEVRRGAAGNAARKHAETLREQHVLNNCPFLLENGGLGRADVPA